MIWVDRDSTGAVQGVYAIRQYAGQEALPDNHADVQTFQQQQEYILAKPKRDREALRQRIESANTTDELKAILREMVGVR